MQQGQSPITYRYTFTFPDGRQQVVTVRLDSQTLNGLREDPQPPPPWTALPFHKCPNCPLKDAERPSCPAALSLVEIIHLFRCARSFQQVEVCVETEARRYVKSTSLQEALSSLIGLHMVTSGCPVMGKLKPLVRHHLPFARAEETTYRVLSMYSLAQFFVARHGKPPDWMFKNLTAMYQAIHVVNEHFSRRLSEISTGDASLNALVMLDLFAQTITFSIDENALDELELLFEPYFRG